MIGSGKPMTEVTGVREKWKFDQEDGSDAEANPEGESGSSTTTAIATSESH